MAKNTKAEKDIYGEALKRLGGQGSPYERAYGIYEGQIEETEEAYRLMADEARVNKALAERAGRQSDRAAGIAAKAGQRTVGQRSENNIRNTLGSIERQHKDYRENVEHALNKLAIQEAADEASFSARKAAEDSANRLSQSRFDADFGLQQKQLDLFRDESEFNKAYQLYLRRLTNPKQFENVTGIKVKKLPSPKKPKPLIIQLKPTDPATKSADPNYELVKSINPDTSVTKYYVSKKLIEDANKSGVKIIDDSGRLRDEKKIRRDVYGEGTKPSNVLAGTKESDAIAKDPNYIGLAFSDSNGRSTICYVKKDVYEFAKARGVDLDVNGTPKSNMQLMRDLYGTGADGEVDYGKMAENLKDGSDKIIDMFGIEDYNLLSSYVSYRSAYKPFEDVGLAVGEREQGGYGISLDNEIAVLDDLVMNTQSKKKLLGEEAYYQQVRDAFNVFDAQYDKVVVKQQEILNSGNAFSYDKIMKLLPEYAKTLVYTDTEEDKIRKAMGVVPASFDIEGFEDAVQTDALKEKFRSDPFGTIKKIGAFSNIQRVKPFLDKLSDPNTIFGKAFEKIQEDALKYEERHGRIGEDGKYRSITDEEIEAEEAKIDDLRKGILNPYQINTLYITESEKETAEKSNTDIEAAIAEQQTYVQWLRVKQNKDRIAQKEEAIINAPDFEEYAAKGAAIENPEQDLASGIVIFGWKPFAEKINNKVTYGRENYIRLALSEVYGSTDPDADYMKYKFMTDGEVGVYNYLLAKQGEVDADEYLDLLEETLNYRMGADQAENIEDKPLLQYLYGFGSGLEQFGQGFRQLFSEEALPTSATAFAAAQIREDLSDDGPKLPDWLGGASLGQGAFDILQTTGNLAPSILATYATAGLGAPVALSSGVGAITMGASAKGNAYKWALDAGYSKEQAGSYSTLIGLSEGGLQYLLGGIGKLGGRLSGKVIGTVLDNIDNSLLRISANIVLRGLSEGSEEYLQTILEPIYRNVAFNESNEIQLLTPEATYNFMLGAVTAGLLDGPSSISNYISAKQAGQAVVKAKKHNELIQNALSLDPRTEAYKMAHKLFEGKTSANAINVGELLAKYINAKGAIAFMYTPSEELAKTGLEKTDPVGSIALKLQDLSQQTGINLYDDVASAAYYQYAFNNEADAKAISQSAANFLNLAEQNISKYIQPDGTPVKGVGLSTEQVGALQSIRAQIQQAMNDLPSGSGMGINTSINNAVDILQSLPAKIQAKIGYDAAFESMLSQMLSNGGIKAKQVAVERIIESINTALQSTELSAETRAKLEAVKAEIEGNIDSEAEMGDNVTSNVEVNESQKLTSKRLKYMGKTPSKVSQTGNTVIERMRSEGKIKTDHTGTQFQASNGKWYPLSEADMAHKTDAVTWWNKTGREFGAKSQEVLKFMLDPDNYYLEHYRINRSQGAKLGEIYLPPLETEDTHGNK